MATLTRRISAGHGRVRIHRIARRLLRRGRYRLSAVAVDAAGNKSVPRTRRFQVIA